MNIELYLVKLTRANGKAYRLAASSPESAIEQVLAVEPYYNREWGITVANVNRGQQ